MLIGAAVAAVVMVTLGALFSGQHGPTAFDQSVFDAVHTHVPYWALRLMKAPTNPILLIAVLAVVALVAFAKRRFDLAVLAAAGPGLSVALSSLALKPLFGRRYYDTYLAYPSGHTTALTATIFVLLVAVATLGRTALTVAAFGAAAVVLACAVIGLVGLRYHYMTDTIGGFCVAGATVALVASVLDSSSTKHTHRDQQGRGVHSMK
ncbi:phosphatase PAP2 family protein [Labedaea rhizosphaerae]|uniref:phosphatase PAP2 family protein n=1 Tax=Labedaea rhizosphaerae TaxID=598644 RepID=UPI00105D3447|nr:phosphatase PAP2 family protein [Labedaea rhizosphaerae]